MANHYLIQAIYGPKPTTPYVNSDEKSDKPPDPRHASPEAKLPSSQHDMELQATPGLFPGMGLFGTANGSDASTSGSRPSIAVMRNQGGGENSALDRLPQSVSMFDGSANIDGVHSPALASLSPADGLFDSNTGSGSEKEMLIHPDRLARNAGSDLEDTDNESNDPSEAWAPSGSNMLPLGFHSGNDNGSAPSAVSAQTSSQHQPSGSRSWLKLPAERYLPPPAPYYDQFELLETFDINFTVSECSVCWGPKSKCPKGKTCAKVCRVCGTKNHPGQTCPSLYCTLSWYCTRRIEPYANWYNETCAEPFVLEYVRQFRPSQNEFPALLKKGMVLGPFEQKSPIIPNMAHPRVRAFYRDQAGSVDRKDKTIEVQTAPHELPGRSSLMRTSIPAIITVKGGNEVNASLDPRLQGMFAYKTMPKDPSPAPSDFVSNLTPKLTKPAVIDGHNKIGDATEERLQELEDEVLKLKMENVKKDREIRRLKAENEQLRGMNEEPGQKRQRI